MNFGVELVRISGIGREDMRREGKWRGVIASLLGNLSGRKHQPGIDLSMVETSAGDVLGDPGAIHIAVTDQYEQHWFDMRNVSNMRPLTNTR